MFKVKVTANFQNVCECLSRWYLLKRWTFYYQTWYGGAWLWTRLSFKKIGLLSSRSRSQLQKISSKSADAFATKLVLMAYHHKVECLLKRLDCSVVVKVKVTEKVKNSSECSCGRYLLSCWPSVTKLCMVMQHHGSKCHWRRLVRCLQVQGHSEGSFNQIWLFLP